MQADASHQATDAVSEAAVHAAPGLVAQSIEGFLSSISARAFRFAELGLRHRDDALDAVQDAMTRMLGYRERPSDEWSPLFWSILRRRVVDLHRRRAFRLRLFSTPGHVAEADIDWADERPDPSGLHEHRETWTRVANALARLPARQREAFTLRVLEEFDVADTARAMGCSEGAVKTHLSRARLALRQQLEPMQ